MALHVYRVIDLVRLVFMCIHSLYGRLIGLYVLLIFLIGVGFIGF